MNERVNKKNLSDFIIELSWSLTDYDYMHDFGWEIYKK